MESVCSRYFRIRKKQDVQPKLNPFTPEDDEFMVEKIGEGLTFKEISKMFQEKGKNRSFQSVCGRYFKIRKKRGIPSRVGIFTTQELGILKEMKEQKKLKWEEIAVAFPNRILRSIRDKYYQMKSREAV